MYRVLLPYKRLEEPVFVPEPIDTSSLEWLTPQVHRPLPAQAFIRRQTVDFPLVYPPIVTLVTYQHKTVLISDGRQAGNFITSYFNSVSSTFNPGADYTYYVPVCIPYQSIINNLAVNITLASSTATGTLGIYACERGVISKLITSNTINFNTVGTRITPIKCGLESGYYFFALKLTGGTVLIQGGQTTVGLLAFDNPNTTTPRNFYYSTTADWEDNPSDLTIAGNKYPLIFGEVYGV